MTSATLKNKMGVTTISTVATVLGFGVTIATPIIYIGDIRQSVAVVEARQILFERRMDKFEESIEYLRRSAEEQNRRQGIRINDDQYD